MCLFWGPDRFHGDDLGSAIVGNLSTATDTLLKAGGGLWPIASPFGPGPIRGSSPAGTTAPVAGGRPMTTGERCSTTNTTPLLYAANCTTCARGTPKSSTSKSRSTTLPER